MNRRQLSAALLAFGAGPSLLTLGEARAQSAEPQEGRDYTRLDPPQPQTASGKIEVLEFFTYACPHCNAFEPQLAAWARALPADVAFRRVPVAFMYNAENFQRTYYALESMGAVDTLQQKIFAAVHVERQKLDKVEDIAAVVAKNGGDAAKFTAAFKSFSVATAVSRAKKAAADYRVDSVPTLAVNGRFITSPALAGGTAQSLAVADALIRRARKA
ncbi:MAG: thiol:disulfide interchange protein DsbA/DsbL [Pseudomonadota bacterium]|nr:thiol:disulfide interchange protein DsbA/DsbL [Pseudomonadota bacterium]